MKRSLRIVTILLGNLLLLALLMEVAGLIVHYQRRGTLFYSRSAEDIPQRFEELNGHPMSRYLLQPYWGFSGKVNLRKPRLKQSTNNYGFVSEEDYPTVRKDRQQAIIGVFGGSVAAQFTWYGSDRLKEVLSADQRFTGRDLVVLNFAGGGYKQPQQLQILSYFLSLGQQFDLVINIDGFNEAALSPLNRRDGIELAMPSATLILPLVNLVDDSTLTPQRLDSLYRITKLRERLRAVSIRLNETHSAAVHLVLDSWHRRLEARYSHEVNRFQSLETKGTASSLVALAGPEDPLDDEEMFRRLGVRWAEASLLMHQLLLAREIPYHHFLQPNQYFTERIFSEEEKALALREDSPLRGNAARGYPYLRESGARLTSQNVRFHDATGIFDHEASAVYEDNCCHYNQLGNEILAEFIARRVLESP